MSKWNYSAVQNVARLITMNNLERDTNVSKQKRTTIDIETFVVGLPRKNHVEEKISSPTILGFYSNINMGPMISYYTTSRL